MVSPFLSQTCAAAATSAESSETSTPCGFEPSCIDRVTKGVKCEWLLWYQLRPALKKKKPHAKGDVVKEVMLRFVTIKCFWQSLTAINTVLWPCVIPSNTKFTV